MAPEILRLGPLVLHGYGTMVGLGLVLCWFVLTAEARRKGLEPLARDLGSLYLWMLLAGFVGGKLYYVATSFDEFRGIWASGDWRRIFGKGFVFYGSLLTCIPVFARWLKPRGLPFLKALDVVIYAAPIMLGMGRVGCFLAGCCYGHRTDVPWAVVFTRGDGLNGVPLHPAQLYETLGCALIFAFLWFFVRGRERFDGHVTAVYFVLYGVERFTVEFFRGDVARGFVVGGEALKPGDPPHGLAFSQVVSIPVALLGVLWLWRGLARARRGAPSRAELRRRR
ncbi:MAG TPA: prolipoprotein diacylglyceryl transferase [Planctomycetota bacterium]|nr:prolipoprotein diacylglyceryl transferase [Planctomycetota bacterium]